MLDQDTMADYFYLGFKMWMTNGIKSRSVTNNFYFEIIDLLRFRMILYIAICSQEAMLLRHHNEAESLHAVQKMDWEWKLKELVLCESKATPKIDEAMVPMVHVSDDFDLLPA